MMVMRFSGHECTYCGLRFEDSDSKQKIVEHISSLEASTRDFVVDPGSTIKYVIDNEEYTGTVVHCVRSTRTHANIYKVRPNESPFWHSISIYETQLLE